MRAPNSRHQKVDLRNDARTAATADAQMASPGRASDPLQAAAALDSVTLVSAVRVSPGVEEEHRRIHHAAVAAAARLGGLRSHEFRPARPGIQADTVALLTFDDRAALDRWLNSDERREALDAMAELHDGSRTVTVIGGFAGWLSVSGGPEPRRWKQAIAVVLGLVPVSLVVTLAREAVAPDLPLLAALIITALGNVAILTWLVMPVLSRLLRGWLSR
jgi:uncharacterized protein